MESGEDKWIQAKKQPKQTKKDKPASKGKQKPASPAVKSPAPHGDLPNLLAGGVKKRRSKETDSEKKLVQTVLVSTEHFTPPAITIKFTRPADPHGVVTVVKKQTRIGDFFKNAPNDYEENDQFVNLASPEKPVEVPDDNEVRAGAVESSQEEPLLRGNKRQRSPSPPPPLQPTRDKDLGASIARMQQQISENRSERPVRRDFMEAARLSDESDDNYQDELDSLADEEDFGPLFNDLNGEGDLDRVQPGKSNLLSVGGHRPSHFRDYPAAVGDSAHPIQVDTTSGSEVGGFGDDDVDEGEDSDVTQEVRQLAPQAHQPQPPLSPLIATQPAPLSYDVEDFSRFLKGPLREEEKSSGSETPVLPPRGARGGQQQQHQHQQQHQQHEQQARRDEPEENESNPRPKKFSVHMLPVISLPEISQTPPAQPPLSQMSQSSQETLSPEVVQRSRRREYSPRKPLRPARESQAEETPAEWPDFSEQESDEAPSSPPPMRAPSNWHSPPGGLSQGSIRIAETPTKSSQDRYPRFMGPTLPSMETLLAPETQFSPPRKQRSGNLKRKVVVLETQGDFSLRAFSFPQPPGWESTSDEEVEESHKRGAYYGEENEMEELFEGNELVDDDETMAE